MNLSVTKKRHPGRPFVKGDPRCGMNKYPIEFHLAQQLNYSEFKTMMFKIMLSKPEELENFRGTSIERALASVMHKTIHLGDPTRLEFFLNRLYGKVPERIEMSETDQLAGLSDEQLYERMVEELKNFKQKRITKDE